MNNSYMVVCSDCFSGGEEYTIGFLTPRKCEKCGNVSDSLHAEPRRHTYQVKKYPHNLHPDSNLLS